MAVGAVLYAAGLAAMAYSTNPAELYLSCGLLIGFGVSGTSFTIVIGAFGKLMPEKWRSLAFGIGTAAGSFGQFLFSPLGVSLIDTIGWQGAILTFAGLVLLIAPLSLALATAHMEGGALGKPAPMQAQSYKEALAEAAGHRSYILLVTGFFTCGFQLAFVTVHLPSYLLDRGLSAWVGGWTLAVIGLCNIAGSMTAGWLGSRVPKRFILSTIYIARAIAVVAFITLPASTATTLVFGAVTGFLWLSTVPPTSGLVAVMFGTRWLAMLFGIAFFSHQVGGFLGIYLGGVLYERTGSYDLIWWLSVVLGIISAILNLPIVEKPVARPAVAPA
jgi:MFS family permease